MVFEILAAISTLVFVILVYFIVITLRDVRSFLQTSKTTVERIQIEVASINSEITPLVRGTSEVVQKVNNHIEELDPLMESIHNVGSFLNDATAYEETHNRASLVKKKTSWQESIAEMLVLTSMGIKLVQQFQKRR